MGPVLLQEETGIPAENLQCFAETKLTLIR